MRSPAAGATGPPGSDERSRSSSTDARNIRVIRDAAELASIREAWLQLQGDHVAVDPDFYEAALRADPKIVRPHVVVLEDGGTPHALLVARIESLDLPVRAGYRTVYRPGVRALTIVYGGILGDVDEETFRLLLASVRRSLAAGEADLAIFRFLPVDSSHYRTVSTAVPALARQHLTDSVVHWELELPDSLDDVLARLSKKTRKNQTWYMRRLERDYEGRLSIRVFTSPDELDEFFRDVDAIAELTYQSALGLAFGGTPAHRERTRVSMEAGWFRGYVLSLEGRPAAFHHGELYRGRFRLGRPGYDPEFAQLSIGTYLLLQLIKDLCADEDARILDYGIGDADYKRRFGTRSWDEANAYVWATTFRGIRINLTRTALLAGVLTARRILERVDLARALRRRWRRGLKREPAA